MEMENLHFLPLFLLNILNHSCFLKSILDGPTAWYVNIDSLCFKEETQTGHLSDL